MTPAKLIKISDAPKQNRDSIALAAIRDYLQERRRALLTELNALNRALGLPTIK